MSFRTSQVLRLPGEPIRDVYFLTSGLVSAMAVLDAGEHVECLQMGYSGAVGALAALGFETALAADVCFSNGHAWKIRSAELQRAMEEAPAIAAVMRRCCEAQIAYALRVGACNSMHAAEARLARWLLTATAFTEDRELRGPHPQDGIASALGLQRSSFSPMLQKFKAEGCVAIGRGWVKVIDPAGLRRRACGCVPALEAALAGP